MSQQLLFAFIVFAIVMFFTPGPNNIMLLASGLNFGFRRTLPHVSASPSALPSWSPSRALDWGRSSLYPVLHTISEICRRGVSRLSRLVAIGMSGPPNPGDAERRRPMTFFGAALFQWVNVKGWVRW